MEIGPFRVNISGNGLVLHPESWNRAANLLFLESPFGTGFSYTGASSDRSKYTDEITASDTLHFLLEWFRQFPEYSKNEFYMLGESYAGHYVPTLAEKILDHNAQEKDLINFKGFALGNPWTDPLHDNKGTAEFFYSHSIIPEDVYHTLMTRCNFSRLQPILSGSDDAQCRGAGESTVNLLGSISHYNIYKAACTLAAKQETRLFHLGELLTSASDPCRDTTDQYLNMPAVQAALKVKVPWSLCNTQIFDKYDHSDILTSMLPVYKRLIAAKLRIWIYSGDLDGVVSTLSTRNWIKALNLTTESSWRAWSRKNKVGGWTQTYTGLNFVTVREAGHMVPADKPREALYIFEHFLAGKPLAS